MQGCPPKLRSELPGLTTACVTYTMSSPLGTTWNHFVLMRGVDCSSKPGHTEATKPASLQTMTCSSNSQLPDSAFFICRRVLFLTDATASEHALGWGLSTSERAEDVKIYQNHQLHIERDPSLIDRRQSQYPNLSLIRKRLHHLFCSLLRN